jgi:acyl dehydratase
MTAEQSLITDEMRASIGVEGPPRRLEVDRTSIRMFARAAGHTDPVFYDVEEARRRGHRDLIAPPGYLGTGVFAPAGEAGPRRRPGGLTRGLNGGNEYEYYDVITAGDVLEARSKTVDIQERQASIGRMIITRSETTYRRLSDGKVVARGWNTGISY